MKRSKRAGSIVFTILFVFCCAFLCSCGKKETVIGVLGLPATLDPQVETAPSAQNVFLCAFAGLLRNEDGALVCDGAESYALSDDGKTLTFRLRDGLQWSNGSAVTADDYAFAVERILRPETKSGYADLLLCIDGAAEFRAGAGTIRGVSCPDERTLVLRLHTPDDRLASQFAATYLSPCSREFFESTAGAYGMTVSKTLFNGSYKVTSKGSETVVLSRVVRDRKLPAAVRFRDVSAWDAPTLEKQLSSGKMSAAVSDTEIGEHLKIETTSFTNAVHFLAFGSREGFCGDPDFARALSLSSAGELQRSSGQMTALPSSYYEYLCGTAQPMQTDAAASAALLRGLYAKYGLKEAPKVVLLVPDDDYSRRVSDQLVTQWQKNTGLFVSREYLSAAEIRARLAVGDFDAAIFCGDTYTTTAESYYAALAAGAAYTGVSESLGALGELTGSEYILACERILAQTGRLVPIGAKECRFYRFKKENEVGMNPSTGNIEIYRQ